ncbi:MAG: hypothetical protein ACON5B_02195 [Myxococcota bacterium]
MLNVSSFPRPSLARLPLLVPLVFALLLMADMATIFAGRMTHPYDLEWMEGGMLTHAWRVHHGLPLYVEPSPEFIPMIYPPGYPTLLAVLGWIFPLGHGLGRAVSLVGTGLAASALVFLGWRHAKSPALGLIGAAIYFGCYPNAGAFQDLVRPDALFVGLLAWSMVLAPEQRQRLRDLSALLLFAAFTVKHNAAAFGVPLALGLWARHGWRAALRWGVLAASLGGAFTLAMDLTSDGNFTAYILDVPRSHPIVDNRVHPGTIRELSHAVAWPLAVLCGWALAALATQGPRLLRAVGVLSAIAAAAWVIPQMGELPMVPGIQRATPTEAQVGYAALAILPITTCFAALAMVWDRRVRWGWVFLGGIGVVAFGMTALMRGHHGGYVNVFMFAHWGTAAACILAVGWLMRTVWTSVATASAAVVLSLHLSTAHERLTPDRYIPTVADVEAGDTVVAELAKQEGPVLSPFAPWLAAQAGHAPGYHLIALWDVRHPEGPFRDKVRDVTSAILSKEYGVVVDAPQSMGFGVAKTYDITLEHDFGPRILFPKTGWRKRPTVLRTPKD